MAQKPLFLLFFLLTLLSSVSWAKETPLEWKEGLPRLMEEEKYEEAERIISKWIRNDRKSVEAWRYRFQLDLAKKDIRNALKSLEKIESYEKAPNKTLPLRAEYHWQNGEALEALKIYQGLSKTEKETQKQITYLFRLADLYEQVGDLDQWESVLIQALKKDPLNPMTHYRLGKFKLMQRQDLEAATRYFSEYLKRAKESEETRRLQDLVEQLRAELQTKTDDGPTPWEVNTN